jgi:hypothetical protein
MAFINFLVSVYPRYDSFFCKYMPGGPYCSKCPLMVPCSNREKALRCSRGQNMGLKPTYPQDSRIRQGIRGT